MTKISSPNTTTTTAVVQRIDLPESQVYYTLRNTGTESIWWHSNLSITDAAVNALASTAAGRALGLSELKVGETNSILAHNTWIKVVWDVDGGAGSTLDIEPGILAPDTILSVGDLNIGNVDIESFPTDAKVPASVVQVLAGTPAPIALPAGFATAIYLQAARANGPNVGNVFIGIVADLVSGTKNYVTLTPGSAWEYKCRLGTKVAMATFGIDGETATDGVIGYSEPV